MLLFLFFYLRNLTLGIDILSNKKLKKKLKPFKNDFTQFCLIKSWDIKLGISVEFNLNHKKCVSKYNHEPS